MGYLVETRLQLQYQVLTVMSNMICQQSPQKSDYHGAVDIAQ